MSDNSGVCFFKVIALFNIFIIIIILVDFYSDDIKEAKIFEDFYSVNEYVPNMDSRYGSSVSVHEFIKSTDNGKYYISANSEIVIHLKPQDTFTVAKTYFFGKAKHIILPKENIVQDVSVFSTPAVYLYIFAGLYSLLYLFIKSTGIWETFLGLSLVCVLVITGLHIFVF